MGTICGTGAADRAFRGMSPYVGSQSCAQRIYCAKLMYEQGYQYMRNPYVDPWGCTSSRPAVINNSWANDTCPNPPTPIRWTGSDASSRIIDAEVFTYNQLYVFAAGNQGDCSGPNTLGTIATPAAAKNVLGVACVLPGTGLEGDPGIAVYWSGRGPCGDGRWKPNVAAPGCEVTSTRANSRNGYVDNCGTSMAAPHVTGIMAGVAERYPEVRSNAALFRAWAMATAVTWQDASPTSGVSLPPTHLNSYGLGRISSIKAHEGGGSRPWTRTWSWGTVSSETDTFDFTVGSGVTRLMVVLAWDDPAAASGANPARVKDVDLYLDRAPFTPEGNTAEYGALSVVETVEHIVVNNPAAGSYRVKVYPYSTANTVRWGAMAIQLIGDTTPAGTLSATADRTYVVPGGAFNVNVTASSASYLATNLLLTQQNVGTQLLGTSTTLKDGVVLNNLHQTGTVTLGDVLSGDPRSITYTYRTISEGVVSVSYQARSDNWGTRNASTSVTVDGTAPPLVTSLQSTSHGIGTWSNTRNMTFTWSQSPDNVSGIAGYGEAFAGSSPVPVPATIVFGPATTRNVTAPSDSGALYFGLRAVDRAGNWNGGVSVGPYRIDTTLPTNPTNVVSSTHALNTWSNNPQINVTFTPASDSGSGLGGYAVIWDHSPTSVPTGTLVLPAGATSWSASVTGSAQGIWLHLRARDLAGNWGPTAHSGPYLVDTTPPGPVSVVIVGGPNATSLDVTLSLTAVDTHSGVAEMRFQNDGGSFSPWEPYAASRAWNLAHFGGSTATGSRAVRAEFRDRAGNGAGTSGSIYYYVPVSYFGSACDGSLGTPVFTIGGIPGIGRPIFFQVSNTAAPLGYLWMGLSAASWNGVPLPLELGPYGVPGCSINVSADILFHAGGLTANYTIADEPVLVGLVVYFQWVLVGDPSGRLVVTTRGAALTHSGR
jgi:hypothetical protein